MSMTSTSTGESPGTRVVDQIYYPVARERSWRRPVVGALVVLVLAAAVYGLATNRNFNWGVFAEYLVSGPILRGLVLTLQISALALMIGLILGTLVALGRMSRNPVVANVCSFYVWLLRGLPGIVQLLFWGNIGLFVPRLVLGVPFTDIVFGEFQVNRLLTPFVASVIALGLAESAYMGEIIRGGIQSVDSGQREAAAALGMKPVRIMGRIVLPQAMRAILPSLGNQFSNIVKASALVSVIAGGDLLTTAQNIAAQNYRVMELLFVASFWYLIVLAVMTPLQGMLERRMRRMDRV